jgi:hypothetical protein
MQQSEDLGVAIENLNDRQGGRSFAVALHRSYRRAKGQVGAIATSPVRRFFSGKTGEGLELIGKAYVQADRLYRIHEPDSRIVVRPEERLFTYANAQRFGCRCCFGNKLDNPIRGRGSGEV